MKNKKVMWSLVVLVVLIWGTIAYQLYAAMSVTDDGVSVLTSPTVLKPPDQMTRYVYLSDVRDPFKYAIPAKRDTSRKAAHGVKAPAWIPPPMKLTGVMAAGKRKTAILEGNDGLVFFLHEGDTLRGVKLLRISNQAVSYVYRKKKDEWVLRNN